MSMKVEVTGLKSPNDANTTIADATGVQVKLWIGDGVNNPDDIGAPDVLETTETITGGVLSVPLTTYEDAILAQSPIAVWPLETNGNDIVGTRHLTVSGASFGAGGVSAGYLRFDGIDDYAEVASSGLVPTGDFSWQKWVNVIDWAGGATLATFMGMQDTIAIRKTSGANEAQFFFWSGSTGIEVQAPGLTAGTFALVTLTYNDTTKDAKIYINKSEVGTANWAGDMPPRAITHPLTFGCDTNPDDGTRRRFANVDVSWAAIYNSTLTPTQIGNHYDAMIGQVEVGSPVLGVAKWEDSNETYFFPIDTTVQEDV